ncbi:hypothetical protein [Marinospirillum alkaliphilum]|uniref:Uncharacterized protein n=1 Tax=Marinospirillum alkaliphilum DSM 21637 TaxID=1122209 RepID=A0A1K1UF28_9GAMM|nr:hypothetical protein [Marinospirillum alkaliphilum]SFX11375.1 hypothetical protein SAMN02745752_00588 [Marinospirillum alkaliphilum DSM 21637]
MKASTTGSRLIGLTLLALLLFLPPILLLFDRPGHSGLSILPFYIFIAWLGIIALAAWILERDHEN